MKTSRDARQTTTAGHAAGAASLPQERGFGKGFGNARVLTQPLSQRRDPRGRSLRSLGRALLQRAALIIHPVALELAQQVKEAFLVRRGPVDFLGRERRLRVRAPRTNPRVLGIAVPSPALCRAGSWLCPGRAKPHSLELLGLCSSDPRGSRHCHSPNPSMDEPRAAAVTAEQPQEPGG